LTSGVTNGILNLNPDGSFEYTPNPNFFGTDSFSYIANDGEFDSNEATVELTINQLIDEPRELKEGVLGKLSELKSQTDDRKSDKRLDKAIREVTQSLKENRWIDETHLDPKKGKKVFNDEKKAANELRKLLGHDEEDDDDRHNGKHTDPNLDLILVQMAIDDLCEADRVLAQTAIDDVNDPQNKDIKKAIREMTKAAEDFSKDRCDKAIKHYEKAWKHAQKAMKQGGDNDDDEEDEDDDEREDKKKDKKHNDDD